jgi:DNA-binding MarR family transcriptional regulator
MLVYKKKRYIKAQRERKTPKQLERHFKGVANHHRIEILFLIANNKGIILDTIAEKLDCNVKTISEHTRRLAQAGLIRKKYIGHNVEHELSPYGKTFYSFINKFSNS